MDAGTGTGIGIDVGKSTCTGAGTTLAMAIAISIDVGMGTGIRIRICMRISTGTGIRIRISIRISIRTGVGLGIGCIMPFRAHSQTTAHSFTDNMHIPPSVLLPPPSPPSHSWLPHPTLRLTLPLLFSDSIFPCPFLSSLFLQAE